MVDIQSATAEIRRGKKKKKKNKLQEESIMSASATQGGHGDSGPGCWEPQFRKSEDASFALHLRIWCAMRCSTERQNCRQWHVWESRASQQYSPASFTPSSIDEGQPCNSYCWLWLTFSACLRDRWMLCSLSWSCLMQTFDNSVIWLFSSVMNWWQLQCLCVL